MTDHVRNIVARRPAIDALWFEPPVVSSHMITAPETLFPGGIRVELPSDINLPIGVAVSRRDPFAVHGRLTARDIEWAVGYLRNIR